MGTLNKRKRETRREIKTHATKAQFLLETNKPNRTPPTLPPVYPTATDCSTAGPAINPRQHFQSQHPVDLDSDLVSSCFDFVSSSLIWSLATGLHCSLFCYRETFLPSTLLTWTNFRPHSLSGDLSIMGAYIFKAPSIPQPWRKSVWSRDIPLAKSLVVWKLMLDKIPTDDKFKHRANLGNFLIVFVDIIHWPSSSMVEFQKVISAMEIAMSKGDYHTRIRKLVQTSLSPESIKKLIPDIETQVISSLESWVSVRQLINAFCEMKKPNTFMPFGNGVHSCPGSELAKLNMLILIHHLVTKFRWEVVGDKSGVQYSPFPIPLQGLPTRFWRIHQ
ncbi:unnamed protein product [Vicia faba]|uniref:Uncharacterized protein n=1 Tax=Vicia faba TaxID=3906 RepID=A0AAV1B830_VICFA|nr:unnamed protein product [Vicia faba]